ELERYISINPEVKIMLGIGVDAPEWWAKLNPDELIRFGDKTTPELLSSPASLKLREDMGKVLKANLEHWETSKFAPNIIGYRITSQADGGEYQLPGGWDGKHADYSPAMQKYFRKFLREKYGSDKNLQKAWNKSGATLDTAEIPGPDERKSTEIFIFRDFSKSKNVADFEDCLNYMMADWAMYFGKIARSIIPQKLLGVYGGYVPGYQGFQLMNNGHLQFGRIYDSGLFDFFCSPNDYSLRQVGMPGGNHAPVGSVNLRKQFFWTENDTRTFLCGGDNWSHVKNLHESIGVLKRDFAANLIVNSPMYFLDMNGGWFSNPGILEVIGDFQKIGDASIKFPGSHRPEVAIMYDTDSIYHINENSTPVTQMASLQLRQNLAFAGVNYDQYLLEDIVRDDFPAYKCYIIVNAFAPSKAVRKSVKDKLQKNNSIVVWAYGSGFFDENDKLSAESIRELTGIEYAVEMKEQVLMLKANDNELVGASVSPVGPFAHVVDKNVEVLCKYNDTDKIAVAVKKLNGSVAIAAPVVSLSPKLWRDILGKHGVHIFTDGGDPVMYNGRFVGIHARNDGEKKVVLPQSVNICDAFTGKLIAENTDTVKINMPRGKTELFFLGSADDISKYREIIKK
ncbi:MAG: beta-galactosidase, partial [Lentisphaerae bacterium]|nr:beta-galactosidase [Lentisphaerota bacterium]